MVENKSDFELPKDILYGTFTGRLYGVYCEYLGENDSVRTALDYIYHLGWPMSPLQFHIDGLAQDCSNSCALAMELLQSCAKPSTWLHYPPVMPYSNIDLCQQWLRLWLAAW